MIYNTLYKEENIKNYNNENILCKEEIRKFYNNDPILKEEIEKKDKIINNLEKTNHDLRIKEIFSRDEWENKIKELQKENEELRKRK